MLVLGAFIYVCIQCPVVQRAENAVRRINHFLVDSALRFVNIYPVDSDLSGG